MNNLDIFVLGEVAENAISKIEFTGIFKLVKYQDALYWEYMIGTQACMDTYKVERKKYSLISDEILRIEYARGISLPLGVCYPFDQKEFDRVINRD